MCTRVEYLAISIPETAPFGPWQLFGWCLCGVAYVYSRISRANDPVLYASTRGCIGIHSDLLAPFGVPSVTLCDAGKFSVAQSPTLIKACWENGFR
jgi:hypothetical protein